MSEITELLLTTAQTSLQWTISAWDYTSGNTLKVYKNGGTATPKTLTTIGSIDYLVTAETNKPLLHVWPINSQEQVKNFRMILPEPARCLAVSPNGCYLAVGIGAKLYIWQIESGKLLRAQQKNYQALTCLRFSSDGDFVVVAGQDGMLLTYNFGDLINVHGNVLAQSEAGQIEPLYKRMDHSQPICDVAIGQFGYKSRFASVSTDHTCRVYRLLQGDLLLTLFHDEPITTVVFERTCWNLYIGGSSGEICGFHLKNPPRSLDQHIANENCPKQFIGHTKKITCLDLNIAGAILASGSADNTIIIWDTASLQMLRQLDLKSPPTNLKFILSCENMFAQQFKPRVVLKSLERTLNTESDFKVAVVQNEDICFSDEENEEQSLRKPEQLVSLLTELETVKVINHQLYEVMLNVTEKLNQKWITNSLIKKHIFYLLLKTKKKFCITLFFLY